MSISFSLSRAAAAQTAGPAYVVPVYVGFSRTTEARRSRPCNMGVTDKMPAARTVFAARPANNRSRIGNGKVLMAGIDGRSARARYVHDVFAALCADAGCDPDSLMGNAAGHKPGYAFASGPAARIADAALDAARREYDAMLTDAWRSPNSKAAPVAEAGQDVYAAYEARLTRAWRSA